MQMCLGTMPGREVAVRFGLTEFYDLGNAVRSGNIRQFNGVLFIFALIDMSSNLCLSSWMYRMLRS